MPQSLPDSAEKQSPPPAPPQAVKTGDLAEDRKKRQKIRMRKFLDCHPNYKRDESARRRLANPESSREYLREWSAKNKSKWLSYKRKYYQSHPEKWRNYCHNRRANTKGGDAINAVRKIHRRVGICFYCGRKEVLTVDHIKPLSRGGAHSAFNIVGACSHCNKTIVIELYTVQDEEDMEAE